jgi:glycosyltransferase involved in cell wall biosynthesis
MNGIASGIWADSEPCSVGEALGIVYADDVRLVSDSGLFDAAFYRDNTPEIAARGVDPVEHFITDGWRQGRQPNRYFDTNWYLQQNPDVARAGANPLRHYIVIGEAEGRAPSPIFDLAWYATRHRAEAGKTLLAHFLRRRFDGSVSPVAEFDAAFYLARYPDVAEARVDPFEHYLLYGYREGRDPSPDFDTRFYLHRYLDGELDQNPLLHFRAHRQQLRLHTTPPHSDTGVFNEVRKFVRPGPDFEQPHKLPIAAERRAKVLAYYLPQFHTVPENDAWWGTGFTEWTAIARAMPRFEGHYQPRIPRDLGHYTLGASAEGIAVMRKQIELARGAGLFGFVHYFYWFNGRRLLADPLEAYLAEPTLDLPFCLMWANENWTRRWDGSEDEVLISQDYRRADDVALIDTFARHFRDPRYIRVAGRPLLMIYRADTIPETPATIARWRKLLRDRHDEYPVLVISQSFGTSDPRPMGFDGAIEFPPHKLGAGVVPCNGNLRYFDLQAGAHVYRYDDFVAASLAEPVPDFPLIKTAVPSWDNDARRQGAGLALYGSTPAKYQAWIEGLVEHARAHPFLGEPFVCVNAWNEWAEGAYLEPDVHYGAAYLNATARAVTRAVPDATAGKLLLVGHDAFAAGAQHLLLHLLQRLQQGQGLNVEYLLLGDGKLTTEYAAVAAGAVFKDPPRQQAALGERIADWVKRGFTTAVVNTSAAAWIVPKLKAAGMRVTLLVHEMPRMLREKDLVPGARAGAAAADCIVFAASAVRDRFAELAPFDSQNALIMPQGSYRTPERSTEARARLRAELGIGDDTQLVLGAGYADLRKGFDLFLQVWRAARRRNAEVMFCWIGDIDPLMRTYLGDEIAEAEATGSFRFAGFQKAIADWLSAADVFALTSREDPFPAVVQEAMCAGLATVAFADSGGIPEMLMRHRCGEVVPMADADAMADSLLRIAGDPDAFGGRARLVALARAEFDFDRYSEWLLRTARPDVVRISAVVPSYNYANYLERRLASITAQTYPLTELIVLDDASTDDSLAVARMVAAGGKRDIAIIGSAANSGSVFRQWRRAAELSRGDYLWIAEADDDADRDFLATLAARLNSVPDIDLAFCDSRSIDGKGAPIWPSYGDYYRASGAVELTRDGVFPARDFARRFLGERNLILNASAVLWKRPALLAALDRCGDELSRYRMAGDWRVYIELLAASPGHVAYVASPLNVHRRHDASVTHQLRGRRHRDEIARVHRAIRDRLGADKDLRQRQAAYLRELAAA